MRIALGVEYDGACYFGWQRQKSTSSTVQEEVEKAISVVANEEIAIVCAGRTDARVHAREQVIHFDTTAIRQTRAWVQGVNANLPADIRILWMQAVDDDFHARFCAAARYYRYEILNRQVKSALHRDHVTTIFTPLDAEKMQLGANHLLGVHDFTSLRAQGCQAKTPIKHMHAIDVRRVGEKIIIDVVANAFLHHMVRNIVGTLLPVAKGEKDASWVAEVLEAKDRKAAGVTARPNGLFLSGIYYPKRFGLPTNKHFEAFSSLIEASKPPGIIQT